MKKIAIFGGSFDPIHKGHIEMALAAKEEFDLDKVFFVVANISPEKQDSTVLSPEERFSLVEKALAKYSGLESSRMELDRAGVSYSHKTVKDFKKLYPEIQFYWIIGADVLLSLNTWQEAQYLKDNLEFIVCPRETSTKSLDETISSLDDISAHALNIREINVSSTDIRNKILEGNIIDELIPSELHDQLNELYSRRFRK